MLGDSVTLQTDTIIQEDDLLLWTFGAEKSLIAKIDSRTNRTDEKFSDRQHLDEETGTLTITNITDRDSGQYKLQIITVNRPQSRDSMWLSTVSRTSLILITVFIYATFPVLKSDWLSSFLRVLIKNSVFFSAVSWLL